MARHYNPSISERVQRTFSFKSGETLGDDISGPVATIEIHPETRFVREGHVSASASSTTIFTTPTDKDFLLTAAYMALIKDATCDVPIGRMSLNITPIDGVARELLTIPILTLTAQQQNASIQLMHHIRLKPGTTVTITMGTYTVGLSSRSGVVCGYTEEVTQT